MATASFEDGGAAIGAEGVYVGTPDAALVVTAGKFVVVLAAGMKSSSSSSSLQSAGGGYGYVRFNMRMFLKSEKNEKSREQ
jgi:hypothetical protein